MDKYKAPKLKLKKRKKFMPKASKELSRDAMKIENAGGEPELIDISSGKKSGSKIRIKKKKKDSGKGKIQYRVQDKPAKVNIIDARGMTREAGKEMLERERLKKTKKRYKQIMKALESIK